MIYLIPLLCFLIPAGMAYLVVWNRLRWVVPALIGALGVIMGWTLWQARQHVGWDAFGYLIVAVLMTAPAILGLAAGAGIAVWRRRRAENAAPPAP